MAVRAAHSQPQEPLIVQRDFVQAEMVKLGKPRDKFWLPKVHAAAAPAAARRDQAGGRSEREAGAGRGAEARGPEDVEGGPEGARTRAQAGRAGHPRGAGRRRAEWIEGRGRPTTRSATSTRGRSMGATAQNYNLPAGMTPDQIRTAARDPVPVSRTTAPSPAIKLTKTSGNPLRRRCLRQRRAADAQGAAASAGVEGPAA